MNEYKITCRSTDSLSSLLFRYGNTRIQPIDRIVFGNKAITIAKFCDKTIYQANNISKFRLDISIMHSDIGENIYMNYVHVTDGLICARYNDTNDIYIKVGAFPTGQRICLLTIDDGGIGIQNFTNRYNVYAKYNEDTKTLYLTDEAEEA